MPAADSFIGLERRTNKFDPGLVFDAFDLVRQRGLRDVQLIGSTGQATSIMDRLDRPQMPELNMHM